MNVTKLFNGIKTGDRRSIAKSITLIESNSPKDFKHQADLLELLVNNKSAKKSIRIGISGVTGAGKSSLIEKIGLELINMGKKIGVLAVDPSSPITGGSILGDKTRMEKLSNHESAYVRPSPNKANSGGLAISTRESVLILENAGYDFIFIETVGVGQSEYTVNSLVDVFIILLLPSTGDELQGSKKGINELADLIIINKADLDLADAAKLTRAHYRETLGDKVILGSIKDEIFEKEKESLLKLILENSEEDFHLKRKDQQHLWLKQAIQKKCFQAMDHYFNQNEINKELHDSSGVYKKAQEIFEKIFK
ncbi:MAG: methylmalonyl Co-A mutase-associated GTPase MeaB [Halobacteriovoraceae bacterium]|nr:methylmalonyl Co-A mutase-associated GTPase MeaB [Halobacteriovoraceae bacterium]|tara:strand:+ start:373 stop:1299 length:927 start_codon:yes stop_codon:yes gene_type:complete